MSYECNYSIVDKKNPSLNKSWSNKSCFDGLKAYIEENKIEDYTIRVYCAENWKYSNKLLYTDAEILKWFEFLTFCQLYAYYNGEIVAEQGDAGYTYNDEVPNEVYKYKNCRVFEVHSSEHINFNHLLATLTCVRFLYESINNKNQIPKIAMEFKKQYTRYSFIYSLTLAHMIVIADQNHTLVNEFGILTSRLSRPLTSDLYQKRVKTFDGVHSVFGNHENINYAKEDRVNISKYLQEGKYSEVLKILN